MKYVVCQSCLWNDYVTWEPKARTRCPSCRTKGQLQQLFPEVGYRDYNRGLVRQKCPGCRRVCWLATIQKCSLNHRPVQMQYFPSGMSGYRFNDTVREHWFKCPVKNCPVIYDSEDVDILAGQCCPRHPHHRLYLAGSRTMLASGLGRGH